ncbi:MAG TPA: hypothetical protein VGE29_09440 [Prosthecobacter sp.]
MDRKAIIIEASYTDPATKGAEADAMLWRDFLESDIGGGWRASDVLFISNPSPDELNLTLLKAANSEYAFVVFCGRGDLLKLDKPWRETALYFGPHGTLTESLLTPKTPKCTLLFDCCRYQDNLIPDQRLFVKVKSGLARERFDESLKKSENGLVKIFAKNGENQTGKHQSFSRHLIQQAQKWAHTDSSVLGQDIAFNLANEAIKSIYPLLHCEYFPGRRSHHFPFAVHV